MRQPRRGLDWTNTTFLAVAHLLGVFGIVYLAAIHFSWWTVGFSAIWWLLCGLAITAGYHRLFSHGSYKALLPLRLCYLFFGAAAVQNSALRWAADHRAHHADTDGETDPYSALQGFWWSHIGWVMFQSPHRERHLQLVRDLQADPLVRFQDRFCVPLAILFGLCVPMAIGCAWGDPIGTGLVAGFMRLVALWHATFSVNSFTHLIGKQTYDACSSARNSLRVALFTLGEGYHSFHHRFQNDYRNGIRWFDFDPTKWWVWTMSKLGLTWQLRRVPVERITAAREEARLVAGERLRLPLR
jgi:stearoyl-CoA desaturase (delta-9 desaturase)